MKKTDEGKERVERATQRQALLTKKSAEPQARSSARGSKGSEQHGEREDAEGGDVEREDAGGADFERDATRPEVGRK